MREYLPEPHAIEPIPGNGRLAACFPHKLNARLVPVGLDLSVSCGLGQRRGTGFDRRQAEQMAGDLTKLGDLKGGEVRRWIVAIRLPMLFRRLCHGMALVADSPKIV
jgi:hypothetical protein